jgi:hypothetical protein
VSHAPSKRKTTFISRVPLSVVQSTRKASFEQEGNADRTSRTYIHTYGVHINGIDLSSLGLGLGTFLGALDNVLKLLVRYVTASVRAVS